MRSWPPRSTDSGRRHAGRRPEVRFISVAPSEHDPDRSTRPIEDSIRTDLRGAMSYGGYLDLDPLRPAHPPRSPPDPPDELLFTAQPQTSELWLRLVLHGRGGARQYLSDDELAPA